MTSEYEDIVLIARIAAQLHLEASEKNVFSFLSLLHSDPDYRRICIESWVQGKDL